MDDLKVKIAIALANCKPSQRKFLEGCQSYFKKNGTLSEKQAGIFFLLHKQILTKLRAKGVIKR